MRHQGLLRGGCDRLAARLAHADRAWRNALTRSLAGALFEPPQAAPSHVLVFRVGNIGDTVTALPALLALRERYPEARVTYLTSPGKRGAPGAEDLLASSPLIDELVCYHAEDLAAPGGRKALVERVRALGCELFVDLSPALQPVRSALRTILFARAVGAGSFVGGAVPSSPLFRKAQARRDHHPYDARRLFDVLRPLGLEAPVGALDFRLPVSPEGMDETTALLEHETLAGASGPLVLLNPGSKRPANRWPLARFRALAQQLREERDARVVVVGSPAERDLANEVAGDSAGVFVAAGELSLAGTVALVARADLLISNDTGTMHVATALGTPLVCLSSARDLRGRWSPEGASNRVLRAEPSCAGCFVERCSNHLCMEAIEVVHAAAACAELLPARRENADEAPIRRTA